MPCASGTPAAFTLNPYAPEFVPREPDARNLVDATPISSSRSAKDSELPSRNVHRTVYPVVSRLVASPGEAGHNTASGEARLGPVTPSVPAPFSVKIQRVESMEGIRVFKQIRDANADLWGPRRHFDLMANRGKAFRVLAEQFEYDNDYIGLEGWKPPAELRNEPASLREGWPLDVKDVPFIDPVELEKLPGDKSSIENVAKVMKLISCPTHYSKLRDPSKKPAETFPRQSKDFAPFREELLAMRYISPIVRSRVQQFVTGFCVAKPKKKTLRSVLDGRPQNEEQFPPPHTNLPGLEAIKHGARVYPLCQELDGTSYFNQFRMHPEIAAHWVLKIGKERFTWNRMPMGWSHAVYVAHTVTEFLAAITHPRGVIIVYIDNVYVFGHDREAIDELTAAFLERCKKVNATFEMTTPATDSLVILGILCDLSAKTVALPASFIEKFKTVLSVLDLCFVGRKGRVGNLPTTQLLWKVFGSLMWGTRVLDIQLCRYGILMNWLSRRASQLAALPHLWSSPCAIWPTALEELRDLIKVVLENTPKSLAEADGNTYDHVMFTDASDYGLGVVHCGPVHRGTTSRKWGPKMQKKIIAERELCALVQGVREVKEAHPDLKNILAHNDNTNVVAWVKRQRGKSAFSNHLLIELFRLLGETKLTVQYVPSALNIADGPSRKRM